MKQTLLFFFILASSLLSAQAKNKTASQTSSTTPSAIKGKLLIEFMNMKAPLINASVYVYKSDGSDSSVKVKTDKYGDFEISSSKGSMAGYNLFVQPATKEVTSIILANQYGVEIAKLKRTAAGFTYKLIQADLALLTDMKEEDPELAFKKFKSAAGEDLKIEEKIIYASGKYTIEKQSIPTLDKVAKVLKENTNVLLEIIAHTDADGNDKVNQALSEKRANAVMDYLVSKGIDAQRLTAVGKGETAIRNRCENTIDCSEKEKEYNRRTEFVFKKN
jgi:outer membrane protein OmpA-like peptidoglycan-associated protein